MTTLNDQRRYGVLPVFAAMLVFAGAIVAILGAYSMEKERLAQPPAPDIMCSLAIGGDWIRLTNLDKWDWPDTMIHIDGIGSGYYAKVSGLKAGESREIPLRQFVTSEGARFLPEQRVPTEIVVHPHGCNARVYNR